MLAANNNAPRAELDRYNDELRRATAEMTISQVAIAKAQTSINVSQAALDVAKAEMATAQWRLSRTEIVAPVDGAITNLTLRVGDTATVNIPMIGIVDAHAWRIMANYKQYYVRSFEVGGEAWVWLDSAPWRFHRAKITGIARGFSRDPQAPMLLPYVAPTTDWIRLQRRIPVTIVLVDPPPDGKLYMGADARTVIFPRADLPMMRKFTRAVVEDFAEMVDMIDADTRRLLARAWRAGRGPGAHTARHRRGLFGHAGDHARACCFEVESPWWAAISGFMSLMATGAGSVRRGILRMIGTIAGAVLGFVMARWLPYDHFALYLFLAAITMLGVIAMQVSPHGLAWLFLTITSSMVLLYEPERPAAGARRGLLPDVRGGDRRRSPPSSWPTCCRTGTPIRRRRRRDGAICSARNGPRSCTVRARRSPSSSCCRSGS